MAKRQAGTANTRIIVLGIDPDVDGNGVARLEIGASPTLWLSTMTFGELLHYLLRLRDEVARNGTALRVVVEAGWLNHGNWHLRSWDAPALASAKGYAVGRNHEAGRKICEMVRTLGISLIERRPLRKVWRGGKISARELEAVTGFRGRSTQDARDAALLAWTEAGLPLSVRG